MISLCNRFDCSRVLDSTECKTLSVPMGELVIKNREFLHLEMKSGSSCGLGDDVFAFSGDEHGVWYITRYDYFNGNPWVHCILFDDVRITLTGIINDDGSYMFFKGGKVMSIGRSGEMTVVGCGNVFEYLLGYQNDSTTLTLSKINRLISSIADFEEIPEDVYSRIISIHKAVDGIASSNKYDNVSKEETAKAMIDILMLANASEIDIESEILRQLKQMLKMKEKKKYDNYFF